MSLLEQLDSAILAALADIPESDLRHFIGCDKVLGLELQRRDCIEAMATESETEARAGIEYATRAAE